MIQKNAHGALEASINNFAIRCFRDTADRDYLNSRLAYKAQLFAQFQWSALHCLEKYSKCIMLLNRIDGIKFKHEVRRPIEALAQNCPFKIAISETSLKFIDKIESARFRYFEVSRGSCSDDILKLDQAVFELRRYCRPIQVDVKFNGKKISLLESNIKYIEAMSPPWNDENGLVGGFIELVLKSNNHPARPALVWNNLWFSKSKRKHIKIRNYSEFEIAPFELDPGIIEEISKYIYVPKEIKQRNHRATD